MKRLITLLLLTVGVTTGAWALDQDTNGYYLIGSLQDWKDFAEIVKNSNTANARMTADINLGNDQTMIGSGTQNANSEGGNNIVYKGTFDGSGHTLTINYSSNEQFIAPFRHILGATIKNLHVKGSITGSSVYYGGIVASIFGKGKWSYIQNCHSSVEITSTSNPSSDGSYLGGLVAQHGWESNLEMTDCIFDGTLNRTSSVLRMSGLVGCHDGDLVIKNCLQIGTFIDHSNNTNNAATFATRWTHGTMNITNSYFLNSIGTVQGIQANAAQIASGEIAYRLQAYHTNLVWGQRIGTDTQPVLTNEENYRVYRSNTGGFTNDLSQAKEIQYDDGYYLISSVFDWQDFAVIVNSGKNTAANAKMTADIDLGDDQTYISPEWKGEFSSLHYHGTFDGQGHTLTVHYSSNKEWHTPFSQTNGATIKNLHVAGTIVSTSSEASHMSGLISNSAGNDVIENVWVSASITGGNNSWIECGAFVGCNNCGNTTITDCLFTGSITTTGGNNGCFAGYVQDYNPSSVTTTNCLSTGTFNFNNGSVSRGSIFNSFVMQYPTSIPSGMQVTEAQLANGTTTSNLNNGRTGENAPWVQDPLTNQPMLKLFANKISYTMPTSGLGTFSAKAKCALPEGLEAYYCKDYNSSTGKISVVAIEGAVPAETGVLLRGTVGATYTLTGTNATAATVTDNALVAVTTQTNIPQISGNYTNFGLNGGEFKKVNENGGTVKANRAYLQILTNALQSSTRGITLDWDDETTAIGKEAIVKGAESTPGQWYTIGGRKLAGQPTQKGIYIVNGKKVVIK